ncbi:MAG: homocysteine biosynthesis protein, partial [Armatimonadetes bacterium]|nr:homocysteine biosynthesis protein [Armatimonadota bacterium]
MPKTYEEINEKIRQGKVVVVTAEEMVDLVAEEGAAKAAEHVDVVTTGTFGPMCSSGAFLNIGHTRPRMKIQRAWLNDVPAYCGLAAVDLYIGATEMPESDPLNRAHPGEFRYGGGHVIHDLIAGDDVLLRAEAYGTDCYPRRELETLINIKDLNEAILCNPRNAYQNYNVAVNLRDDRDIYTYMGVVKSNLGSANYSSAGQLSPLLNDPYYRTIGIGTRIWLGGAQGYVFWPGTQHDPTVPRAANGVPRGGAGTLACVGDMKQMDPRWIVGVSLQGYGASLCVGIGVPLPILDEEMARFTAVSDKEIVAPIVDYGHDYPELTGEPLGYVSYA